MSDWSKLAKDLDITISNNAFFEEAFTHKSYAKAHSGTVHNERMEFLGDAVLKLIVSQDLFRRLTGNQEGDLSKIRAHIVSDKHLAKLASALGLGGYLRLSFGEERAGGRERPSNLANVFEALLGALYLDQGFDAAQVFFTRVMRDHGSDYLTEFSSQDYKSTLQEHMQKKKAPLPRYEKVGEDGPDHEKSFFVEAQVVIGDTVHKATGTGRSKKEAEQAAALHLLTELGISQPVLGSD